MPISGIVLTLVPESRTRRDLLDSLSEDKRFTPGETQEDRLPLVCETPDMPSHRAAWHELEAMPGVRFVELAYHDFSDVEDFGEQPPPRRRRS